MIVKKSNKIVVPVFDDVDQSRLIGKATIENDEIAIVIKTEEIVNACVDLITVDMIRAFLVGFQFKEGRSL